MTRDERLILWIAVGASFVAFMNSTVVTVALPKISAELGGGLVGQQWVFNAYLITLGALILTAGSISDALGRTLVLRVGLIGFAIASIAVAAAPTIELLVASRVLQGAAGAFLVPSSLALITTMFRPDQQARAIGVWTAATSMASIAGPVVGGLLSDGPSWRWAFAINIVPIVAVLLLMPQVRNLGAPAGGKVDLLAASLCALGLAGIVTALIEGPSRGWTHPLVMSCALLGGAFFVAFLVRQRFGSHPILPLALFRSRNFSAGNLATAFIYGALSLNGVVLGLYLQQVAGLSATLAALASLPMTIILILGSLGVGSLIGRFGARIFMTLGPAMMAIGAAWLLAVSHDFDYWVQVLPGVVVFGAGLTVTVSPLTSTILGSVPAAVSGSASAINNAVARVAGLVLVAALAVIVGGQVDLAGFHRAAIVTAVLLAIGALISWIGIRDTNAPAAEKSATSTAAPCTASDTPVAVEVTHDQADAGSTRGESRGSDQ